MRVRHIVILGVLVAAVTVAATGAAAAQVPTCFGEPATIVATPGEVTIGTKGDDVIVGTSGPDRIRSQGGDDLICARGGADFVRAGSGHDRVRGGAGPDTLFGGNGGDEVEGSGGTDYIHGGPGDDWLSGGKGDDRILDGGDDDSIHGNRGRDILRGQSGNDRLSGGLGRADRCAPGARGSFKSCEVIEAKAVQLLAALASAAEKRDGYDRNLFKWPRDYDGDGCDSRQEVLAAESLDTPSPATGCPVAAGRWRSLYDGDTTTDPADLEIDHLVPLAEAWRSGARRWSPSTQARFGNDLGDPRTLIAVSVASNQRKSDSEPARWLPRRQYRCQYVEDWIAVKTRWSLTVNNAERAALTDIIDGCDRRRVEVRAAGLVFTDGTTKGPTVPESPGDTRNCDDFATYAEAKAWFDRYLPHYGDVAGLDGDNDGRPCTSLPGGPS